MHARILRSSALTAVALLAAFEIPLRSAASAEPVKPSTVVAEARPGLNLLAIDMQNSWLHERAAASGWTLKDGKLAATAKSKPLVSTHAMGDFELHVDWRVADGGVIKVCFPNVPDAKPALQSTAQAVEIGLAEQPGISILLPQGAKILKVDPKLRGKLHRIVIKRTGGSLVLDCDGTRSRELPIPADEKFGLALAIDQSVPGGTATIESLRLIQSTEPAPPKP